jgi:uncharacterized protein (TIGR04255 family)
VTGYTCFNEFKERLSAVIEAATSSLDLLFFTRIGLRYINNFPLSSENQSQQSWVNPQLLAPLQLEELSGANRFWQEISGENEAGCAYFLRHGYGISEGIGYILDIDISLDGIEIGRAIPEVTRFREIAKRIFLDSISDYALQWLRADKP